MKNSKKKKSLSDFSLLNSDKVVTNVNGVAGGQENAIKSNSVIISEQLQKQQEAVGPRESQMKTISR